MESDSLKRAKKKYYELNKEELALKNKKWREEHKEEFKKMCKESRKRRVERLRAEGVSNAWSVVLYGVEKKYDKNRQGQNESNI